MGSRRRNSLRVFDFHAYCLDVFGGGEPGDWFFVSDLKTGVSLQDKSRPIILCQGWGGGPVAKIRARSTSVKLGTWHARHPRGHGCQITSDGWINTFGTPISIMGDSLRGCYTCTEPDPAIRQKVGGR